MDYVVVFETSHHLDYGIYFPDMGKELVPEAFSVTGPFDQSCDIDQFYSGGSEFLRIIYFCQIIQSLIRYTDHAYIGLNGAERVVFAGSTCFCYCIEKGALSHIRKSHDT